MRLVLSFLRASIPYWTAGANVFGVVNHAAFFVYGIHRVPTEDTTWSKIKNLYR